MRVEYFTSPGDNADKQNGRYRSAFEIQPLSPPITHPENIRNPFGAINTVGVAREWAGGGTLNFYYSIWPPRPFPIPRIHRTPIQSQRGFHCRATDPANIATTSIYRPVIGIIMWTVVMLSRYEATTASNPVGYIAFYRLIRWFYKDI